MCLKKLLNHIPIRKRVGTFCSAVDLLIFIHILFGRLEFLNLQKIENELCLCEGAGKG